MWKRPVTGAKVLFFLNRYTYIALLMIVVITDLEFGSSNRVSTFFCISSVHPHTLGCCTGLAYHEAFGIAHVQCSITLTCVSVLKLSVPNHGQTRKLSFTHK